MAQWDWRGGERKAGILFPFPESTVSVLRVKGDYLDCDGQIPYHLHLLPTKVQHPEERKQKPEASGRLVRTIVLSNADKTPIVYTQTHTVP